MINAKMLEIQLQENQISYKKAVKVAFHTNKQKDYV